MGQSYTAYGLRSNDPAALEQATPYLPLGWQPTPTGEVDILYSLRLPPPSKRKGQRNYHLLYCGSDEFAGLDKEGRVHPYPVLLSLRGHNGQPGRKTPVESLGGQVGVEPLPVNLVVVTEYQPGARWRPRKLTPGQALLALMDNTVAARRNPAHSMPILKQAVTGVVALKSKRGEAAKVAAILLAQLNRQVYYSATKGHYPRFE